MIDPRAHSPVRIVPSAPLPCVARSSLRRVRNPVPPPTTCRYCAGPVHLVNNAEIYGREYGKWPYAYWCRPCNAYVGLHPGTDIPLGTLANKELRKLRNENKDLFHEVVERFGLSRDEGYENLSRKLGIPHAECHFGWFDEDRCRQAGEICRTALLEAPRK